MRIMNSGTRRFAAIFLMVAFLVTQFPMLEAYAAVVDPDVPKETIITEEYIEEAKTITGNAGILPDQEELLEGHIEILTAEIAEEYDSISTDALNGVATNTPKDTRGSKLTGANKIAYDKLKAKIEAVANGSESSTMFTISFAELFPDKVGLRYSASDLKVDSIVVNGMITEAASRALQAEYTVNFRTVLNALMYDCAYSLFWYDKTSGAAQRVTSAASPIYAEPRDGEWKIYFASDCAYEFVFRVSQDYALNGQYYTTDTSKIKSLETAVQKAFDIVDGAKNQNDYQKLVTYKDAICGLVDYDEETLKNPPAYGDPWQIIYVFDEIESTKVVCEGYAKAFKYLCDLTDFNNDKIEAYIITGNMDGGKGAGGHMWNNVRMDNGEYYLVDVTNCDEGSAGAPDLLFLRGNQQKQQVMMNIQDSEGNNLGEKLCDAYCFSNPTISYIYDDDTLATYSDEELTLALSDYKPENDIGGNSGNSGEGTGGNTEPGQEPNPNTEIRNIEDAVIEGLATETYTGKEIIPEFAVTMIDIGDLREGTDYTLSFSNNVNAGTATLTLTGIGNYRGTKTATFKINPAPVAGRKLPGIPARTYNGKAHTQNLKLSIDGKELKNGTDYTITYKNNINAGTATFAVTYKGNYIGTSTGSFKINKAANPLTVKAKTATLKAKDVKKKARILAISKLVTFTKKGQGKLTYTKASGSKGITIDKKTGTVKVKKGLKKGTYKVKINVTAAGNGNYNKATKTITVTIKIK